MRKRFPVLFVIYSPFTFLKPQPRSLQKQDICPRCLFALSSATHWCCGSQGLPGHCQTAVSCPMCWAGRSLSPHQLLITRLLAHLPSHSLALKTLNSGKFWEQTSRQPERWLAKSQGLFSFVSRMDFFSSAQTLTWPIKAQK